MHRLVAAAVAAVASMFVVTSGPSRPDSSNGPSNDASKSPAIAHAAEDPTRWARTEGLAVKKSEPSPSETSAPPLLATLAHTHTDERLALDRDSPSAERFSALLADRATGERTTFDPRLLDLLRTLAKNHATARIELVSGYRSAKLNEMMRKKGRHVAAHSQHSLGHAVDFRIVPAGETRGIDPRALEKEIRALGWDGGVGVYTLKTDWFVHADVGKNRRWNG